MNKLKKDNKEILYKVIEKNTKHSYIKPQNGYVLITKSNSMSLKYIINKLLNNFDYYYKIIEKKEENTLNLWGKRYKLNVLYNKKFDYIIKEDNILVYYKNENYLEIKKTILFKELKTYLETIKPEVIKKLKENKYYEVPLKFKLLKSKYGSYNVNKGSNYIVLNTFLATLEKEFSVYVLYHEYAHQKVKNHQKEFYIELEKLFKKHRKYQSLLKKVKLII